MIGGNIVAELQLKNMTTKNEIGEVVPTYPKIADLKGYLDFMSGQVGKTYNAEIEESTHVFVGDYRPIDKKATDKRLVVDGKKYDVLLIDDPMNLHKHLEIYLKYTGE